MNFFCRLFGHTWVPETRTPDPQWNTTKEGHILALTADEGAVQHFDVCRRCSEEKAAAGRSHDSDRPEGQPEPLVGTLG